MIGLPATGTTAKSRRRTRRVQEERIIRDVHTTEEEIQDSPTDGLILVIRQLRRSGVEEKRKDSTKRSENQRENCPERRGLGLRCRGSRRGRRKCRVGRCGAHYMWL